ncbi:hypothetical protein [Parvibaculum sp.]|uniref:hypothetical protein n=1 Tax=Parvibaculum sp. TaxID=2024848 RepID=UPI0034A00DB2
MDTYGKNFTANDNETPEAPVVETRSRHASLIGDSIVNEQGCGPEPIGLRPVPEELR